MMIIGRGLNQTIVIGVEKEIVIQILKIRKLSANLTIKTPNPDLINSTDQRIEIVYEGDRIEIWITEIHPSEVKFGLTAPRRIPIHTHLKRFESTKPISAKLDLKRR